jgi:two-component system cell cycle sensor histidine kinase/response regulator CckA
MEQLARHPQEISAIVADVVMPEVDGPAMVEEILSRHPAMRILFMSGYVDSRLQDTLRHHAYIEKPFTAEALARKLRQVLGQ